MSASVRVNNLFSYDPAVLNIIQLKLLRMSKMLEHHSVFISDCDSHGITSFLHNALMKLDRFIFTASTCD